MQKLSSAVCASIHPGIRIRIAAVTAAAFGLLALSLLQPLINTFRSTERFTHGYHLAVFVEGITSDTFAPVLPMLAALPFSAVYVDDIKSKFARFFLLRSGYGGYLGSRFLTCFLLGGSVIALGALLGWGGLALLLTPLEKAGDIDEKLLNQAVQAVSLASLCGGFWAVLGMALSTFMESKYIAYVSPFVVYDLLVILCERYFPEAIFLYPRQWLSPSELWPFGAWGVAVLLLELTALATLVFFARGKRRLMEL